MMAANPIDQYGIFQSATNIVSFAEIILITSLYNVIQLSYTSVIEGKFQNAKLARFSRIYAASETIDLILHCIIFGLLVEKHTDLIPLAFAGIHFFSSAIQIEIRWKLAGFMLNGMRRYSQMSHIFLIVTPYVFRVIFITLGGILSAQGNYVFNMPALLMGELVLLVFDIVVVEYTHILRLTGTTVTLTEYIKRLTNPTHSIMIMVSAIGIILAHVGYYIPNIGYVTSIGTAILMASYYVYRTLIMRHIEGWVVGQKSTNQSTGRSGSHNVKLPTDLKPSRLNQSIVALPQASAVMGTNSLSKGGGGIRSSTASLHRELE